MTIQENIDAFNRLYQVFVNKFSLFQMRAPTFNFSIFILREKTSRKYPRPRIRYDTCAYTMEERTRTDVYETLYPQPFDCQKRKEDLESSTKMFPFEIPLRKNNKHA